MEKVSSEFESSFPQRANPDKVGWEGKRKSEAGKLVLPEVTLVPRSGSGGRHGQGLGGGCLRDESSARRGSRRLGSLDFAPSAAADGAAGDEEQDKCDAVVERTYLRTRDWVIGQDRTAYRLIQKPGPVSVFSNHVYRSVRKREGERNGRCFSYR